MKTALQNKTGRTRPGADYETRASDDHHQALRLWLRFLTCANLLGNHLRTRLRTEFNTTLPRFDLMAQIERAPAGMKMGELSKRLMVTGGNITGITDQLVKEGLVIRETAPNDRRAYSVRLTPAGRQAFAEMAKAHEDWIINLLSGLTQKEKSQLYELLETLKSHLQQFQQGEKE